MIKWSKFAKIKSIQKLPEQPSPTRFSSMDKQSLAPVATSKIIGIILLALPFGDSPIRPERCAPTGLKYLKTIAFFLLEANTQSWIRDSASNLVRPYGFTGLVGCSSSHGV